MSEGEEQAALKDEVGVRPAWTGAYRRLGPPVPKDFCGRRLDMHLSIEFRFLSRSGWQRRIEDGLLLVNGRPSKPAVRLKEGDLLSLFAPPTVEPEVDRGIRLLWESEGVMGVYKPGGLPMHENGPYRRNTFAFLAAEAFGNEWAACHRLDRETSGIVLCGATASLRAKLAEAFQDKEIHKEYLAIARGTPDAPRFRVDGPIGDLEGSQIRIKKWVVADGLPAETDFTLEEQGPEACLLRARPYTGRTNQIRIHAAFQGHVLVGDKLYHPDESVFLEYFAHGTTEGVIGRTGFARCCLHATALGFVHPHTKADVRIDCPMPDDMQGLWRQLRSGTTRLPPLGQPLA